MNSETNTNNIKESLSIRFLYGTKIGRLILRPLVSKPVSELSAKVLSGRISSLFVKGFIKKNNIDLDKYIVPEGGYKSFNEFFTRGLKREYCKDTSKTLISPSDGYLTVKYIDEDTVFNVKHSKYKMADLLDDASLASDFKGGTALIFRLMPHHFHRYCFPVDGIFLKKRRIEGKYHCVRPLPLATLPVFVQNTREYSVLETKELGNIIQMEVGALLVGRITNDDRFATNSTFKKGDEKGYFEYGGSTIILFIPKHIDLNEDILSRAKIGDEIPVEIGESLFIE